MTKRAKKTAAKPTTKKVSTARKQRTGLASSSDNLGALVERVVAIVEEARSRVLRAVNSEMVLSNWLVGREIVEYVQRGEARAEYGEQVIEGLSAQLLARVGRGYSTTNLRYFRTFYIAYRERRAGIRHIGSGESEGGTGAKGARKIRHKRSGVSLAALDPAPPDGFSPALGWSHYRALMKVEPTMVRTFYEIEAEQEHWSVEHLERQIHTQLHLRLLKSRNKDGVMELARKGQTVEKPIDLMKSPIVLDFLGLQGGPELRESDVESAIISKLSQFLLELGKGFAFVARQKRITFEDDNFFVDLPQRGRASGGARTRPPHRRSGREVRARRKGRQVDAHAAHEEQATRGEVMATQCTPTEGDRRSPLSPECAGRRVGASRCEHTAVHRRTEIVEAGG